MGKVDMVALVLWATALLTSPLPSCWYIKVFIMKAGM